MQAVCGREGFSGKWVKRRFRLTRSTDFERVRRVGKSYAHPLVVLLVVRNELPQIRVGVVAGKAVGTAVIRNRAKRYIREGMVRLMPYMPREGWDLVLLARKSMNHASFAETCAVLQSIMERAGLLDRSGGEDGRRLSQ